MIRFADACRSCGHEPLLPVLALGDTPLANALVEEEGLNASEARFPLTLAFLGVKVLITATPKPDLPQENPGKKPYIYSVPNPAPRVRFFPAPLVVYFAPEALHELLVDFKNRPGDSSGAVYGRSSVD